MMVCLDVSAVFSCDGLMTAYVALGNSVMQ